MPDDAALARAREVAEELYAGRCPHLNLPDWGKWQCNTCLVDALCTYGDARARKQRERDAKIAETKIVCELRSIETGGRDPLCAITASTAAVCLTHGRDIAAAIRAQEQ